MATSPRHGKDRDMLIRLSSGAMNEQELHDFMLGFYNRWLPMLDLEVSVSALPGKQKLGCKRSRHYNIITQCTNCGLIPPLAPHRAMQAPR